MVLRCPPEEIFLRRLLQMDSFEDMEVDETGRFVEKILSARCLSTKELMKALNQIIRVWKTKTERLSNILKEQLSQEGGKKFIVFCFNQTLLLYLVLVVKFGHFGSM